MAVWVVAVLGICALLWFKGWPIARAIILILALSGICVASFFWGPCLGGPDKWNILMSVATLLGVIVALFYDEIQKLIHFAKISLYVDNDLIDFAHGRRWVRGKITNIGDRAVKRCRLKLLRVEGQRSRIENGFLQWEGGSREPIRLSSKEHLIFDIGTRTPVQDSPLKLLSYIGENELEHNLLAPGTYTLTLAIYGDNIPSKEQPVSVKIGAAADEIEIKML